MKLHSLSAAVVTFVALFSFGSVATAQSGFEPPDYVVDPLASPAVPPSPLPGWDEDKPFVGQGGWSDSVGNSGGHINIYPNDGLYTGNQALDTNFTLSQRYEGAQSRHVNPEALQLSYDNRPFGVSAGFELYIEQHGAQGSLGTWTDKDSDALFDRVENSMHIGAFSNGAATDTKFGVTLADGTVYYSDGNGGVTTNYAQAVAMQNLGWHRVNYAVSDNVNGIDFDVTVEYTHLSSGAAMGLVVDAFTLLAITADQLGMDLSEPGDCRFNGPDGIYANVFGLAAIDNIAVEWTCACVPEPSTWALLMLGSVGLIACARRRRSR